MDNTEPVVAQKKHFSQEICIPTEGQNLTDLSKTIVTSKQRTLCVEDLMKVLSVGRNTAYNLIHSGRIRSIKIGRIYRIPMEAVDEFLNSNDT